MQAMLMQTVNVSPVQTVAPSSATGKADQGGNTGFDSALNAEMSKASSKNGDGQSPAKSAGKSDQPAEKDAARPDDPKGSATTQEAGQPAEAAVQQTASPDQPVIIPDPALLAALAALQVQVLKPDVPATSTPAADLTPLDADGTISIGMLNAAVTTAAETAKPDAAVVVSAAPQGIQEAIARFLPQRSEKNGKVDDAPALNDPGVIPEAASRSILETPAEPAQRPELPLAGRADTPEQPVKGVVETTGNPGATAASKISGLMRGENPAPELNTPPTAQSAMAAQMTSQTPAQTSTAPLATAIQTPLGTPGWTAEVGNQIIVGLGRGAQSAELTLNPPQLGRLDVTINLQGDNMTAVFVSPSPAVRDALQQELPRLREMFAGVGINLGQADVSAQSQRQSNDGSGDKWRGGGSPADPEAAPIAGRAIARYQLGMVDTFA